MSTTDARPRDQRVFLEVPPHASLVVGGMSVVERVLREQARAGATHAYVRGQLPDLPPLPIVVEHAPAAPAGARAVPADVIAGVRVIDRASQRAAEKALLQSCRRPYDGPGDRYVIRPISLRITSLLYRIRATPNLVTMANILVGLLALLMVSRAEWITAGILLFVQVVLDSCDGELARIRHMNSRLGMWLDNGSDDLIDNSFIALIGIALGGLWQPILVALAIGRGLTAIMIYVTVWRMGKPGDVMAFSWWFDKPDENLAERYEPQLTPLTVLRAIGRRDVYVLLWAAGCVIWPPIAAGFAAGIGAVYTGLGAGHALSLVRSR